MTFIKNNIFIIIIFLILSIMLQLSLVYISKKNNYKYTKKFKILALIIVTFITSYLFYFYKVDTLSIIYFLIFNIMISSSCIDFMYKELPDSYTLIIGLIGLIKLFLLRNNNVYCYSILLKRNLNYPEIYFISSILLFIIFSIILYFSNGLGGGDVKLVTVIGLFIPYYFILQYLIISLFIASIYALYLLIVKKSNKKSTLAFGPFLIIGAIIFLLK